MIKTVSSFTTSAINRAISQAFNAGGGTVFLPSGIYRRDNGFHPVTNSILTMPQMPLYQGIPRTVRLIGEEKGSFTGANLENYLGGVVIDCSDIGSPGGNYPSLYAAAPYVPSDWSGVNPNGWNHVHCHVDNISFILPSGAPFGGLNFANAMQASIGNFVHIFTKTVNGAHTDPTAGTAIGVFMPLIQNNVFSNVGACVIAGFYIGLVCADHTLLQRPYLAYNLRGLFLQDSSNLITGDVSIERCWRMIEIYQGKTMTVDLTLQGEMGAPGFWYSPNGGNAGLLDAGNDLRGRVAYAVTQPGAGFVQLPINGGANVTLQRLR